jgi:YVTN family beta-propeller protein
MSCRRVLGFVVPVFAIVLMAAVGIGPLRSQESKKAARSDSFPGQGAEGFLLPNGWRLTPAGQQVPLTDLPLNIIPSPDGKYAFVATSGYNTHQLTAVELATGKKVAASDVPQSWYGLAADFDAGRLWWSGGGDGSVHQFGWSEGQLRPQDGPGLAIADPDDKTKTNGFRTGVCLDRKVGILYSLAILPKGGNKSFAWGDATTDGKEGGLITSKVLGKPGAMMSVPCGKRPYDVLLARNNLLYVSDWADRRVLVLDPDSLKTVARIPVGEHPNQMVLHPEDDRLFVACASSNAVYVIDTATGTVQETIFTALFPQSPEGSTPDALCLDSEGETLFVANADNNCIAVIDVEAPRRSQIKGYIPTGWYPTALAVTPDDEHLLVGVGKGNQSKSNRPAQAKIDEALAKPKQEGGYRRIPCGGAVDHRHSLRKGPEKIHRSGVPQLPLFRQIAVGRSRPAQDGDSDQGGRPFADQVRAVHHQGESDVRPGAQRHSPRQSRREPPDVRRAGDSQPSQAG